MLPTLKPGDSVVSFNWYYFFKKPKIGDVVVIKAGGKKMVKRIVRVLNNEIIVEGDNKGESTDSRQFGPVSLDQVIGKVILTLQI